MNNEVDKAYFAHDAAHVDTKDLAKRTISDKILKDKAYKIFIKPMYGGHQRGLASMVYNFFDKITGSGAKSKVDINEVLVQELHKSVFKKFRRRKVYSKFKRNVLAQNLANNSHHDYLEVLVDHTYSCSIGRTAVDAGHSPLPE